MKFDQFVQAWPLIRLPWKSESTRSRSAKRKASHGTFGKKKCTMHVSQIFHHVLVTFWQLRLAFMPYVGPNPLLRMSELLQEHRHGHFSVSLGELSGRLPFATSKCNPSGVVGHCCATNVRPAGSQTIFRHSNMGGQPVAK